MKWRELLRGEMKWALGVEVSRGVGFCGVRCGMGVHIAQTTAALAVGYIIVMDLLGVWWLVACVYSMVVDPSTVCYTFAAFAHS